MRIAGNSARAGIALLALVGSIGLSLGLAVPANADPESGVLPLECDELGSLDVVAAGNGTATTR